MRLALHEDLMVMKRGTPVVVNLTDSVSDIGLFLEYHPTKKTISVLDCFSLGRDKRYHANVSDYSKCMLLEMDEEKLTVLVNLLNKKE